MSVVTPENRLLGINAPLPPTFALIRHIAEFLRWRFSLLPQGAYRFVESDGVDDRSDIHISADVPIRPNIVGQRPAITVFRSAAQFQGLGIGDLGHVDLASGVKMRMDVIPTNLMVAVLSREPVEAEILAFHCLNEISAFRDAIIKEAKIILYLGNRPTVSPPSPAGALVDGVDHDWTAVVVGFPTYLKYQHVIEPLNLPFVSGVDATLTTEEALIQRAPAVDPLQGTATMQATGGAGLPQTPTDEANSTQPLVLPIEARQ